MLAQSILNMISPSSKKNSAIFRDGLERMDANSRKLKETTLIIKKDVIDLKMKRESVQACLNGENGWMLNDNKVND